MRFFPRGAFTERPSIPAQMPVAPALFQYSQQQAQQMQQMQQLQRQLWQQVAIPVAGFPTTTFGPASSFQVQMPIPMQVFAMRMDLRAGPLRMNPHFADQFQCIPRMGCLGLPIF